MGGYTISNIKYVKRILNGYTPQKEKLRKSTDFKTCRYLIVLYAASKFPIFEQHYKTFEGKRGFSIYSLMKIANALDLYFDRTKTSSKVYEQEMKKGRVKRSMVNNKLIYDLTKKGILYCETCISHFLELREPMDYRDESHKFTMKAEKKSDQKWLEFKKKSQKEQEKYMLKNPGEFFQQPTKEEHKISLLLQKIKSLS